MFFRWIFFFCIIFSRVLGKTAKFEFESAKMSCHTVCGSTLKLYKIRVSKLVSIFCAILGQAGPGELFHAGCTVDRYANRTSSICARSSLTFSLFSFFIHIFLPFSLTLLLKDLRQPPLLNNLSS